MLSRSTRRLAPLSFTLALALLLGLSASVVWTPGPAPNSVLAKNDKKAKDDKHDDEGDANRGHGNDPDKHDEDNPGKGKKSEQPIVANSSATAIPAPTPQPTPTPTAQPGQLRVEARHCAHEPATADEWDHACTDHDHAARFAVTALDGLFAGWSIEIAADANGVAALENLPAGRYRLDQVGADWCHAESDRVDATGDVVIAAATVTTVWVYTCTPLALGS